MQSPFQKYLVLSLGLHVLGFLILIFGPAYELPEPKETKVTWIRFSYGDGGKNKKASLKSLKTLPKSTLKEQREWLKNKKKLEQLLETKDAKKLEIPDAKHDEVLAEKKTIKIDKEEPKKKMPVQEHRTVTDKSIAKIDDILKQREKTVLEIKKTEIAVAQAKDDETGQSDVGGEESNIVDPELLTYYNLVKRKIQREWNLTKQDYSGNLVAKIGLLIDIDGKVIQTWYKLRSGDGSFDNSALLAIKKAAPYPTPPQSIRKEALTEGFLFEFNPMTVTGRATVR